MDNTTLDTLELPRVLKELSSFASTPIGSSKVLGLKPLAEASAINGLFIEYAEAEGILKAYGKLPLAGAADIKELLDKTAPAGAFLLPEELLSIKGNIEASVNLRAFLADEQFVKTFPLISAIIAEISGQSFLLGELNRIIDEKAQIKDSASRTLLRIRRELKSSRERARNFLEEVSSQKKIKEALQEDFITIRDDRFVLAVMAGKHTEAPGVIHGRSGSGQTYFIEPFQLVELNNRIAILKKEEKAEEIEILKAATRLVSAQAFSLLKDYEIIGGLDLNQAKALFAAMAGCAVPVIKESGGIKLFKAKHPLLILNFLKGAGAVVPIDIIIDEDKKVLVISGANTGGKTVALKTLGLLTLMAQSGIPVPVEEGSEFLTFSSVFADIGDRQDIIASLSTFSAHIKRIGSFLDKAGKGSLVLLDEIGAGTDPAEGSAFGLACLETLKNKGALTIITTHLNLIKAHAQTHDEYLNASVEFDEKTLKPLYALRYGMPGQSFGLSIAQSLGIPDSMIGLAKGFLEDREALFIESVRRLEEEKAEVARIHGAVRELEIKRNKAVEKLRSERAAIAGRARKKIEDITRKTEDELREIIKKFREEQKKQAPAAISKAASSLRDASKAGLQRLGASPEEVYMPSVGEKVLITDSNSKGSVLAVDEAGEKAELMVGNFKVWVSWKKLKPRGGRAEPRKISTAIDADMEAGTSINLLGMRAEEAINAVSKFLDTAHASGLERVEVIHGIGTGRLSKALDEFFSTNRLVKNFHRAEPSQGGGGVTIVELA